MGSNQQVTSVEQGSCQEGDCRQMSLHPCPNVVEGEVLRWGPVLVWLPHGEQREPYDVYYQVVES